MPPILAILIGVGLLIAANRAAPGIAQAVLVLVALYLFLSHPDRIHDGVQGAVERWARLWDSSTYRRSAP